MNENSTKEPARANEGALFDNWIDAIEEGVRSRVRDFIERSSLFSPGSLRRVVQSIDRGAARADSSATATRDLRQASHASLRQRRQPTRNCRSADCRRNSKAEVRATGRIKGWGKSQVHTINICFAGRQAVNVKLLPAPQSTNIFCISCLAGSVKSCPLQCIGTTCSKSKVVNCVITTVARTRQRDL